MPRSEGLSRVNGAFASFPMFLSGDAGRGAIELQVPERYEVELVGSDMDEAQRDGMTVYSEPQADPDSFFVDVIARNDSESSPRTSTSTRERSGCGPGPATRSGPAS